LSSAYSFAHWKKLKIDEVSCGYVTKLCVEEMRVWIFFEEWILWPKSDSQTELIRYEKVEQSRTKKT